MPSLNGSIPTKSILGPSSNSNRYKARMDGAHFDERISKSLIAVDSSVWRPSNRTLVPAHGTAHLALRLAISALCSSHRGWVGFTIQSIFEPGQPQRANACGFLRCERRLANCEVAAVAQPGTPHAQRSGNGASAIAHPSQSNHRKAARNGGFLRDETCTLRSPV